MPTTSSKSLTALGEGMAITQLMAFDSVERASRQPSAIASATAATGDERAAICRRRHNISRRSSVVVIAAMLLLVPAAPAAGWSSSSTGTSPNGCSGGFAGSSAYNYPSSGRMYTSVSRQGSVCWFGYPGISAQFRDGPAGYSTACNNSSMTFCSTSWTWESRFDGGVHLWGGQGFTT